MNKDNEKYLKDEYLEKNFSEFSEKLYEMTIECYRSLTGKQRLISEQKKKILSIQRAMGRLTSEEMPNIWDIWDKKVLIEPGTFRPMMDDEGNYIRKEQE